MIPLDYESTCKCGRAYSQHSWPSDEKPEETAGALMGMLVCVFTGFMMGAALTLMVLKIRSLM